MSELIGRQVSNYRILELLGEGSMARVYRAEHIALAKPVAVKVLREEFSCEPRSAERFLHEARSLSRLRHPNVVDVTDFGTTDDGWVYFIMEYLHGESLEQLLDRQKRLSILQAVRIVRQVAGALQAAHQASIVHRDLKPANVFLTDNEGRRRVVRKQAADRGVKIEREKRYEQVKLLDFGVAKQIDTAPSDATRAGVVLGTPLYMSPEQAQARPVDHRSDIYSLGILFYRMVTGYVPFDGSTILEILNGHAYCPAIPPATKVPDADIDEATDRTIMRCLEKEPDSRFQTMDELLEALIDCYADEVYLRDAMAIRSRRGSEQRQTARHPAQSRKRTLTDELGELLGSQPAPQPEGTSTTGDDDAQATRKPSLTDELAQLFDKDEDKG